MKLIITEFWGVIMIGKYFPIRNTIATPLDFFHNRQFMERLNRENNK